MNIYVGFLPDGFNDEQLKEKFAAFGEVTSAKVIIDRETGLSKGFGFVEMKNAKDGQTAIEELKNWVKSDGRAVKVNEAQPRTNNFNNRDRDSKPRSGFGGGRKW